MSKFLVFILLVMLSGCAMNQEWKRTHIIKDLYQLPDGSLFSFDRRAMEFERPTNGVLLETQYYSGKGKLLKVVDESDSDSSRENLGFEAGI